MLWKNGAPCPSFSQKAAVLSPLPPSFLFSLLVIRKNSKGDLHNFAVFHHNFFAENLSALPCTAGERKKTRASVSFLCAGIDLFSQAASRQVSSALLSLTSVFGMGTGGTSALYTPAIGDPCGNRTRVTGVRGRCLDRLTNGPGTAFSGFARRGFADGRSKGCRPLDPAWYRLRRFWILKRYAFGMERPAQVLPGGRIGAPSGTRTRDPLIKSQLLYQLS